MFKKLTAVAAVIALVGTVGGTSAFANTPLDPEINPKASSTPTDASKKEAQPNAGLKTGMDKLITDAKAGKVAPAARAQIQPAKSNGLSKGAKIAIGVGIAVVVLALIVKYQKDHLLDNFNLHGLSL
jgi:hypothetical protein